MNELEMGGVKSDASDASLFSFGRMILSVADDGMADRGELNANLILQSGKESDSHERRAAKTAFDGIAKLGSSSFWVARGGNFLKHSFLPKVVDEGSFARAEIATHDGKVVPHGRVFEELLNERFAIGPGFCEEENPGGVSIDTMHHNGPLPFGFQLGRKKSESRWSARILRRHR